MPLPDMPHAARPRERLHAMGAAALSDAELLAIVLRTGLPGRHVLQLADDLLQMQHQGRSGLAALLHTEPAALKGIKGLGPAKRAELLAVLELARRALAQTLQAREVMGSPIAVAQLVQLHLAARPHEVFAVLFLDHGNRLLALEELFRGTLDQAAVYPREVVVRALHWNASAVVLAHNHPSGSVQPSSADLRLTQVLRDALALVGVRVLDHLIVAPGASLSMAEQGLL